MDVYSWGRPQRVMLLVMIDRGHRELPIQPWFLWKKSSNCKNDSVCLRLNGIDNEEGVFLEKFKSEDISKLYSPRNSF